MMRDIEKKLEEKLSLELGEDKGRTRFAHYTTAKEPLPDAMDEVIKKFPNYTEHGIDHINRVLDNVSELLGGSVDDLNSEELYLLLMAVLFHDVGMLVSREYHQNQIDLVYNVIRGTQSEIRPEKRLIKQIIRAHSGKSADGSPDTLKDVDTKAPFEGKGVRLRELSAILRFADELDEQRERAANFALKCDMVPQESRKYHEYSQSVQIHIDRNDGRIVLSYDISLEDNGTDFASRIDYVFERIAKLDNERRYVRFHSDFLSPFRETQVTINFWGKNNEEVDSIYEHFVLDDKVLPSNQCDINLQKKKEAIVEKYCMYRSPN